MPRHKATLHAALGGTPDEVEAAFYEALQTGDIEKLMACWADEDEIACIHPGGPRVVGVGAIRAAFDALFAHGGAVHVHAEQIRRVDSLASAVHHVLERVEVMTPDGPAKAMCWPPTCTTRPARLAAGGAPRQPRHDRGRGPGPSWCPGFTLNMPLAPWIMRKQL